MKTWRDCSRRGTDVREMVLNHASVGSAGWRETVEQLSGVADGMAMLVRDGGVSRILRMCRPAHEIQSRDGQSLYHVYQELRRSGARDQYVFLLGLSAKVPLDSDLGPDVAERFLMCESKTLPPEDGAPLVLCAISDAVSVSVPSESTWDRDRISVDFQELLPNGTFDHARQAIDNLARTIHARRILDRHRQQLRYQCSDPSDLWTRRGEMFPGLIFGPDVEKHLSVLNVGWLPTLVNRLADLDQAAQEWRALGGDAPPWKTHVSPESESLMKNRKLREARRFRSSGGAQVLFEWHARFGSGARIHLRFDARTREIEIGYIGVHLPM